MKCGDYIDISPRIKLLDTGISLDNKELISLEQIVKTASKGHARFTSNVMAIVGEGIREAEINVFGNKIRTKIPRYIDRIVKSHNTISQNALNALTFVWVYATVTASNPPLYVSNGTGSLVFVTSSGQQISFSPTVLAVPNGVNTFTFLFLVNDTSTNSYSSTQEQLNPWVVYPYNTNTAFQLSSPLSVANLVISKSSNQVLTFVWAVQVTFASGVSANGVIGLFQPHINGWHTGFENWNCATVSLSIPSLTVYSGSSTSFSATPSYYFVNVNGVLYAVALATDASGNAYVPSSIQATYWAITNINTCPNSFMGTISVATPPNPPGSKPSYAAVSWYNGFYLTT
jgi:hypothetical protein